MLQPLPEQLVVVFHQIIFHRQIIAIKSRKHQEIELPSPANNSLNIARTDPPSGALTPARRG